MNKKIDLSIDFCGIHCENPFLLSSSCIVGNEEMSARALQSGWAGLVFKTIGFYHPEEVSPRFDIVDKEATSFIGFRNLEQISDHSLEENLTALKNLKKRFPNKVIISSIMGQSEQEWQELARLSEAVGVDIIECNFSCPQMAAEAMGADVGVNPELVAKYCAATRRGTKLPILAKMTPNITDMTIPAIAAIQNGADGLAAINTIKSITNIDYKKKILPSVAGKSCISGYSGKAVKPIALRFVSDMANCLQLKNVPISGIGGIETWQDALEFILLGSQTVQVTTSVMQYGYRIVEDMIDGLAEYMRENNINALNELVGASLVNLVSSQELERDSIVYPYFASEKCVGCGRCYIACQDAGHQAIDWEHKKRQPSLITDKCVGCHLCRLVCPTEAIGISQRQKKAV
ncbi:NAD-dependent dihydropyrimidine dehydrogenase subunit PreA [Pectinatus brassicae]|uniref:dihydrouracil dehydrogenase (NAD(+)) n=1 Tax=Pectinatus brassicae TaxID=862415 RepID=A0A840UIV5_9FIRM|nr:NAD-dependent dihydropyrimidine dehydrogenase subunit PreA [Pectinatus brassicae]MBB5336909.1 dihydropyrimidine dehydrogenase (NAD+) subunit PreA [Pectinatus brassicae]